MLSNSSKIFKDTFLLHAPLIFFCKYNCLLCLLLSCRLTVLTFHVDFHPHISGLISWKKWHYFNFSQVNLSVNLFYNSNFDSNESENWWWRTQWVITRTSSAQVSLKGTDKFLILQAPFPNGSNDLIIISQTYPT